MQRSKSGNDGTDRPWRIFRKPDPPPPGPHITYISNDDPQRVPFHILWPESTDRAYRAICKYPEDWIYLGSVQGMVPPCAALASIHKIGKGCRTNEEPKCFGLFCRALFGHGLPIKEFPKT